jgi:hypothetical protein
MRVVTVPALEGKTTFHSPFFSAMLIHIRQWRTTSILSPIVLPFDIYFLFRNQCNDDSSIGKESGKDEQRMEMMSVVAAVG